MTIKAAGYQAPICPKCGRKTIYFRKDGTIVCRACGYTGSAMIPEKSVPVESSANKTGTTV